MELDSRIGHFEPANVDAGKQVVGKGGHLAAINDKVAHLMASKPFNGFLEDLWILDVATVGDHLNVARGISIT